MRDLLADLLAASPFRPFVLRTVLGDRYEITASGMAELGSESLRVAGGVEPVRYEEIVRIEKLS